MAGPLQLPVQGFDDISERNQYRHRNLRVLASNNPFCLYNPTRWSPFPPMKAIFPYQDAVASGLASIYESHIHPAILHILETSCVIPNFRELHLIRMGFEDSDSPIPLVLLIIFEQNSISVEIAKQIVSDVAEKLNTFWNGEQVYIDICRHDQRRTETNQKDHARDYNFVYDDSYPLPGSSIGPTKPLPGSSIGPIENDRCTGTLCGYITHDIDVFALTNHHVVNIDSLDCGTPECNNPYKYIPGQDKRTIVSPSNVDHLENIQFLQECRSMLQDFEGWEKDPDIRKRKIEDLDARILQAKGYNRDLGYIYATSGNIPPAAGEHRQDWAIIHCGSRSEYLRQNKHRRVKVDHFIPVLDRKEEKLAIDRNGVEIEWLQQSKLKFFAAPVFGGVGKPLIQDEPHYLKPPSARSGFRLGVCNGIRSTLCNGPCGITREWTFISPKAGRRVAEFGDSGSSLLDKDHNIAALIWGGDAYDGIGDLTFAIPFSSVLQDIESRMGWEPGSCAWITE